MTEIKDLRDFISSLDSDGQLVKVSTPVSIEYELADVAASIAREGKGACLFENVTESPWPVFCGGVASHSRAAVALGCELSEVADTMENALDPSNGVSPIRTDKADWQDNTISGSEIDLKNLPILTHSRGDSGPFITGAVTVSKDPISGRGNLSYNRMSKLDKNILGFNVNEWRDVGTFWKSRENPDDPFPIALAMGLDPAIMIAAGVKTHVDELFIAGAIRGRGCLLYTSPSPRD